MAAAGPGGRDGGNLLAAGPLISDDEPSALLLAGMMVLAADGMLVNLADTPANRAMFGSTGTADDSSPFPQLRVVALTARAGRAILARSWAGPAPGSRPLLRRLVKRRPDLVAGRVTCFDRNFPGYDLITAILDAGGLVIVRMKEGISLDFEDSPGRGWPPDRSRLSWPNAPSGKKADPVLRPGDRAQRDHALRRRDPRRSDGLLFAVGRTDEVIDHGGEMLYPRDRGGAHRRAWCRDAVVIGRANPVPGQLLVGQRWRHQRLLSSISIHNGCRYMARPEVCARPLDRYLRAAEARLCAR